MTFEVEKVSESWKKNLFELDWMTKEFWLLIVIWGTSKYLTTVRISYLAFDWTDKHSNFVSGSSCNLMFLTTLLSHTHPYIIIMVYDIMTGSVLCQSDKTVGKNLCLQCFDLVNEG